MEFFLGAAAITAAALVVWVAVRIVVRLLTGPEGGPDAD